MTHTASLPLPSGQGWIAAGNADLNVVYRSKTYTATATHEDEPGEPIRVSLTPDDIFGVPSVWLAFSAEQWATIFAVVASVAPKPVWSMTETMKRRALGADSDSQEGVQR